MTTCDDTRQLTQQEREDGAAAARQTGVVRALRPFSGSPTPENICDYLNRELVPAVQASRGKLNEVHQQVARNAPSANPLGYYFSTDTTNADPTTGRIRLDSTTQNAATTIRVSEMNAQLQSVLPWLEVMAGGITFPIGTITLMDAVNPARYFRANLLGTIDQGAYWDLQIDIFESSSPNPFVDGEGVLLSFLPAAAKDGVTLKGGIGPMPGIDGRDGDEGVPGPPGAPGAIGAFGGAVAALYNWFDGVPINSGQMGTNNPGGQSTMTALEFNYTDANGAGWQTVLRTFIDPPGPIKGYVRVVKQLDLSHWLLFQIGGMVDVPASSVLFITGKVLGSSATNPFATGDRVIFEYTRNGDAGPEGHPGSDGIDGVDGIPGIPGPPGAIGASGLVGLPGSPGIDGDAGPEGQTFPGPAGPPGIQGANGNDGLPGPVGVGIDGIDGVDGTPGAPGPPGTQGIQGLPGNSGPAGNDGIDGIDGTPAIPGPAGNDGQPGAPGRPGQPGDIGDAGPEGPMGTPIPGPAGNDGAQGLPGIPGQPGNDGAIGPIGEMGMPGPQGSPGNNGNDGLPGAPIVGNDGADGLDGVPGLPGQQGATGAAGANGFHGPPGADGQDATATLEGMMGPPGAPFGTPSGFAPARSAFVNATNALAVPAFLAGPGGTPVYYYLRHNSAGTALEWGSPADLATGAGLDWDGLNERYVLASVASDTFLGNISGSSGTPTATSFLGVSGTDIDFSSHRFRLAQRGALSVMGNNTTSAGIPADISASSAYQYLRTSADATAVEFNAHPVADYDQYQLRDDFSFFSFDSANSILYGDTPWTGAFTGNGAPAGMETAPAAPGTYPGEMFIDTGSVSGGGYTIFKGLAATDKLFNCSLVQEFVWIVRLDTVTNAVVQCGLGENGVSTSVNGAGFFYSAAGSASTWQIYCIAASSSSTTTIGGTVAAGTHYRLRAVRNIAGTWTFTVNGGSSTTLSKNPSAMVNFYNHIHTTNTTSKRLFTDYCHLLMGQLGR